MVRKSKGKPFSWEHAVFHLAEKYTRKGAEKQPNWARRVRRKGLIKEPLVDFPGTSLRVHAKLLERHRKRPMTFENMQRFAEGATRRVRTLYTTTYNYQLYFVQHVFNAKELPVVIRWLDGYFHSKKVDARERQLVERMFAYAKREKSPAKAKRMVIARVKQMQAKYKKGYEKLNQIIDKAELEGKDIGHWSHVRGNRLTTPLFSLERLVEIAEGL
jgi:hypothetical protein